MIHPTACVSAETTLASDVNVGPFAVIKGLVTIAAGCDIAGYARLIGPLRLGANNTIGVGCVIGAAPQHLDYTGAPTTVEIGQANTLHERVTIHRAMDVSPSAPGTGVTRIGNRNIFMAGSHVGHDCRIGNDGSYGHYSLLGGHVETGDGVVLSGQSSVHPFCRIGRLALLDAVAAVSKDIPPFWIQHAVNRVSGVNVDSMQRAGIPTSEIEAVTEAFRIIYLERLSMPTALSRMEAELSDSDLVCELIAFIRASKRGICGPHHFEPLAEIPA